MVLAICSRGFAAGELPEPGPFPFLPLERVAPAHAAAARRVLSTPSTGAGGEDGQLQGLEPFKRPITGAGLLAMAAGLDKRDHQAWSGFQGLPVVPYVG